MANVVAITRRYYKLFTKNLVLYKYLLLDIIKINLDSIVVFGGRLEEFFKDIDKQDYKFSDCMSSREPFLW